MLSTVPVYDVSRKHPKITPGFARPIKFPVKHSGIWKLYQDGQRTHWVSHETAKEIEVDQNTVATMPEKERHLLLHTLAFFAQSDVIVGKNLNMNFIKDFEHVSEVGALFKYQAHIESVHEEAYSMLIDAYVSDPTEREKLFRAVETIPTIGAKADWAMKWIGREVVEGIDDDERELLLSNARALLAKTGKAKYQERIDKYSAIKMPLGQRVLAFAFVEGGFFSSSFATIFWFRHQSESGKDPKTGKKRARPLPALYRINDFISRDEGQHTDTAIEILNSVIPDQKPPTKIAHAMAKEAVEIECASVRASFKKPLLGLNAESMCEYVKFVFDEILQKCGYPSLFGIKKCPLSFMNKISIGVRMSDFLKTSSAEYEDASAVGDDELDFAEDY